MNKNIFKTNDIYGDSMFPLSNTEIIMDDNNPLLNCHWHDEIEFILITSGTGIFQIEDSNFEVCEGDILLINSGELHSSYILNKKTCIFKSIVFNLELLSSKSSDIIQVKFINPLINNQILLPRLLKNETPIKDLLNELFITLDNKELNYELMVKSYLYMIFSKIMSFTTTKEDHNNIKTENIKHILNYIHNNFNKTLTISELASEINMSEGHFCRIFKSFTLKTPIDYINYYRCSKAQELLIYTQKKILEISMDVGFNNLSYFISIFKNQTGYTPSQFRKKFGCL